MASAKVRQLAPHDMIVVEEVSVAPEGVPRCRISQPWQAGSVASACRAAGASCHCHEAADAAWVEETKTSRRDPCATSAPTRKVRRTCRRLPKVRHPP